MEITSSYAVEIIGSNTIFRDTIKLYRSALAYLIGVVNERWNELDAYKSTKQKMSHIERLVHTTKQHAAVYDFDQRFYKMPVYLRRAATTAAIGCVSSYKSSLANWEDGGKQGRGPRLRAERFAMPTFYKDNMYTASSNPNEAYLKLYHQNDWVWVKVHLKGTDVRYIQRYWSHCKASAPTLEKKHGKYFLRFAFVEKVKLSGTPITQQRVCAVDLGLNTDAVCSIMTADGTVLARKFVNFPSEKDHLYHILNRIKKFQRKHGSQNVQSFWRYAQRLNIELAKRIANAIVEFAVLYSTDCIVFEHLDFRGKKAKGSKKQKIQMWRKNSIQDYVEHKAHRCGMRISRICAWGTSRLAYDGSGVLVRDEQNHALATFANGKQYNCDLGASYNIGARYFIRELLKPLPATARSQLSAKVPGVERRTSCTLATLRAMSAALA